MRLIVTGASGYLGRQLVPRLRRRGIELLLAGRDPAALAALFDGVECTGYADLGETGAGFDAILHLAARNNDRAGSPDQFRAANVHLVHTLADAMRRAGVARFVFASTTHAFERRDDAYSLTKREAEDYLRAQPDLEPVILNLAAVYADDGEGGALSFLRRLPGPLRPLAGAAARALRPAVHVSAVEEAVLAALAAPAPDQVTVTDRQTDNPVYAAFRRLLDWSFVLAAVVLLWWLFAAVYIAVKASSPGPGVLAQRRVGRNMQPFTCYKFRTMYTGTREAGTHQIAPSAITPVGRLLRRTKIDELPQVLNLILGNMSLIGPRPCLPVQEELVEERRRRGVYDVLPGITGLAQVRGIDMSDPAVLARVDCEYVALRTIPLDVKILFRTLFS